MTPTIRTTTSPTPPADYCMAAPCRNGATCTDLPGGGFTCSCEDSFYGRYCERETTTISPTPPADYCMAAPCRNGATCTDIPGGGFTCSCEDGFYGRYCERGFAMTARPACASEQFQCDNGNCVSVSFICDNDNDCGDGSDEGNCTESLGCQRGEWLCHNGQRCIFSGWRCDGTYDCFDHSDEMNCPICSPYQFKCDSRSCVSIFDICDGMNDCADGSDEANCTSSCPNGEWRCHNGQRCINSNYVCDGDIDCYDSSDEMNCTSLRTPPPLLVECPAQCSDGQCLYYESWICDGDIDCYDGSDELNCRPAEDSECKSSTLGLEYRGQKSTTIYGRTCQRWDSQYPHEHSRDDQSQFPDAVYNEENYCRNPDHEGQGPWCYTTDSNKRWEYCGIPLCEDV